MAGTDLINNQINNKKSSHPIHMQIGDKIMNQQDE